MEEAFRSGMSPREVCKRWPELSRGNVYRWHGRYEAGQSGGQSGGQPSGQADNPDDRNNVVRLVSESSDPAAELRWVRNVLRSHILNPDKETTPLAVPAAQAYLRAIQIETQLPKSEEEGNLSDEERATRIIALVDTARNRRDRSDSDSEA